MSRRPAPPPAPLPQRLGIDPVRLRLPLDEEIDWPSAGAYLRHRLGGTDGGRRPLVDRMLTDGGFVTADGSPLPPEAPYSPGLLLWYHRELPAERPVPFPIPVLYRDERILVVDKPPFVATIPRGRHVTESALARLRRELDLPELSAAHRLDRLTSGVVLFVLNRRDRAAYQGLFQDRRVRKEYRAVARHDPALAFPRTVRDRLVKERGELTARVVPGEPNAESRIELLSARGGHGLYRLLPATGRTHQLRVHMRGLGLPILGDRLYSGPEPEPDDTPEDWTSPLQLLARSLEFEDPVTGERFRFRSRRELVLPS
ncbi:pseudouridine synthase [Phaeacidiphilus oryzae]|uniref:pseudouridine synthase n=1 Tax=Phaeacidiphilus oryzae TaxID=348818 RepID=UPI000566055A|nr:pseudouridine synthase [Phaeacidiphilus oryzae]